MLTAGQRPKHPMQIPALGVDDSSLWFEVASAFGERLRPGDVVQFIPQLTVPHSPLWAKTWRVAKVTNHVDDTKKVFVVEVK